MKLKILFTAFAISFACVSFGQTTILSENFGTTVGAYPTGWASSNATNGFSAVTTTASAGYTGASGSVNARFVNSGANGVVHTLTYSNTFSTVGYVGITVLWGARATATFAQPVTFEWSPDGTTWSAVTYTQVASNATWAFVNGGTRIALPAGAQNIPNLRFRFSITSNNNGNYQIDDFSVQGVNGIITTQNGDWHTGSTWLGGVVPTSGQNAIVNHDVTSAVAVTRDAGTTTTINAGRTLTMSNTYTNNGTTTVNGVFVAWTAGVSINAGSTFMVNGTCYIYPGGFFVNGAPIFGASSSLIYASGGTYGRGLEWSALGVGTIGVTPGYPNHVQLSLNTALNYNNGTPLAKAMNGNLTVNAGSSFFMDFGGGASGGSLTVGGNLINGGTITLGNAVGDDLRLGGNILQVATAVFNGNNRAVFFTKNGTQSITTAAPLTIPYVVFQPVSGSTTIQLLNDVTVSAPVAGGNAISFSSASDVFDLNGRTLTIGTAGITNAVSGAGTFKGSTTSNLNLLGAGNIGTLNFTTGSQNLGTLSVDRTAGATAFTLGTPVTVNTALTLTNGRANVGNNPMTMGSAAAITSSVNNFVIADIANGTSASLRKVFTAAGNFVYPIGDNSGNYTPATLALTGGAYAANAYAGVAVNAIKHPSYDSATNFLSRYWDVVSSGVTAPTAFTASAVTYANADITGTEASFLSNKWNGAAWSNAGAPVTAASNIFTIGGLTAGATNHITAGLRDMDINIKAGAVDYLDTSTYDFGTQIIGSNTDVVFTIENLGQQSLTFVGYSVVGSDYAFNPAAPAATPLAGPTGTRPFTIRFTPSAAGTITGYVIVATNDPTPGENSYRINFTGVGVLPSPEINVKGVVGVNPTIFSGDVTPSGTDNTQFAAQTIGNSQVKSFRIENIGTANLNVSAITLTGANPGDFIVTAAAPYVIAFPSGTVDFTITFQPTASGLRTATVNIAHDDLTGSENPYTFVIEGTGNCAAATNVITPLSGPVNTEVTITASANNLTGATATFNGVAATVIPVSATEIKVIVPAGATSGSLVTTNAQGCQASNVFTVIDNAIFSCEGGTPASELFISEVTDSNNGGLSYIEIYNGTAAAVFLPNYGLQVANNGGAYSFTTGLTGAGLVGSMLPVGGTYIVGLGDDNACATPGGDGSYANQTNVGGGINFVANQHDHIALFNMTVLVDSWGTFGSLSWAPASIGTNGATFRRKDTAPTIPNTTYSNADWDIIDFPGSTCANNDYTDIGTFDFSNGTPPIVTAHPVYTPSCKATSLTVAGTEGVAGSLPLAYQWFAAAPGATTWTALTNAGIYTGTTTATLNISNLAGLDDYQFYCQIRENTATCYTASNAVKIDEATTVTWNGTAWLPSAPAINTVAVINGPYDTAVNGSFEACSVTVNGGFTLTIGATDYVSIQNDLTVNATGNLVVLNQGSIVMIDDAGVVTNNGTTQIQKTTTPYNKFDYTYWSTPVSNATIAATFPTWRLDYAFQFATANYADVIAPFDGFDDNGNAWLNASGTMTPGKGYAIMAPTSGTFPATSTVTFSGAVNNGVINMPVALSANGGSNTDDFNLIGNPYPSALYADQFIDLNAIQNARISGTLYFWTHRTSIAPATPGPNANNFITADYAMYNLSGAVGTGIGTGSGTGSPAPTGYIASAQGFFVDAQAATNVVFNNGMRDASYANTNFFRLSADNEIQKDRIWLNLESEEGLFSQQLIGYFENATLDYDVAYDGIVNKTSNAISFYSFIGNDHYRIQARPSFDMNDQVPLGYSSVVAKAYTISIGNKEGQLDHAATNIYVEDKLLNIIHDLKQSAYSFTTEAGTFDDRFLLRYTNGTLGNPEIGHQNNVAAIASGSTISVKSYGERLEKIAIYDIAGRRIFESGSIGDNQFQISDIIRNKQALILRIILENGQVVTRKLIF